MHLDTLLEPVDRIEDVVEREVRVITNGRIRGLQVRVLDGQLIITGRTSTYHAKQLVSKAALETADHLSVVNEVEVC